MSNVPRCPRCGHNFYEGGSGICKWCQDEIDNPSYCHICGAVATCSGYNGYLCDRDSCSERDEQISNQKFLDEWEELE